VTDNAAVKGLLNKKLGENKRVDSWILRLQGLSFTIEKIAGSKNIIADGLSRAPLEIMENPEEFAYFMHTYTPSNFSEYISCKRTVTSIHKSKVCIGTWPDWVIDQSPSNSTADSLYRLSPSDTLPQLPLLSDDNKLPQLYRTLGLTKLENPHDPFLYVLREDTLLPTLAQIRDAQHADPDCQQLHKIHNNPDTDPATLRELIQSLGPFGKYIAAHLSELKVLHGVLYIKKKGVSRILVPLVHRQRIIAHMHFGPGAVHQGIGEVFRRIKRYYIWPACKKRRSCLHKLMRSM
jgi:hypothetical protein